MTSKYTMPDNVRNFLLQLGAEQPAAGISATVTTTQPAFDNFEAK